MTEDKQTDSQELEQEGPSAVPPVDNGKLAEKVWEVLKEVRDPERSVHSWR